jgi:hypothetical protein
MLTRYRCNHVGRENLAPKAKAREFIRFAEVRDQLVEISEKECPDCKTH